MNKIDLSIDLGEGWGGGDNFAWARPGVFLYNQIYLLGDFSYGMDRT